MSGGAGLAFAQAKAIAAALDPPFEALSLHRFDGASAEVFEIVGQDRSVVLKIYADEPAWKLGKEQKAAARFASLGVAPTPRWLLVDETRRRLARRFVVMTRLPGQNLRARYGTSDAEALFLAMGALLRRLHALAMPSFGYLLADDVATPYATNAERMADAFAAKFRDFRAWGGGPAFCAEIERFVARRSAALDERREAVLCHNDFHPGNVLAARGEDGRWALSSLVDFENAVAADPLYDLAKALDYTAHECAAGRAPLEAGYGPIDRAGAAEALLLYRIFHKLELLNGLQRGRADPPGPSSAALLADLADLTAPSSGRG